MGILGGGRGVKLKEWTTILAGVCAILATLMSLVSIWLQLKNYRKPLLQRYVVRILIMVPIYAIASWTALWSLRLSEWVDPIRDIYEAFTIYTFFQLLINFLDGERSLIIMTHGRKPVSHLWPMHHCLSKIDISDPHTFLAIKRGILQYAYIKPLLSFAAIIMKATDTYQEGYIGLQSGYLWTGILYNVSVTLSLYCLALFWVCMSTDLKPFRPVPKFLCIKLIIFASYWQGFFLSILVALGAIPDDVRGYTPDNLAAAIQDALICCEMPAFAIAHWYAFSWHDYADVTIHAARMPIKFAIRDAFGPRDLIEDTKQTFSGEHYEYRIFDTGDNVLAHEDSKQRRARIKQGMRYERNGRGKYWLPEPNITTPLLGGHLPESNAHTMAPAEVSPDRARYGATDVDDVTEICSDDEDEGLFTDARTMEFGDWNYPVITAHEPDGERWREREPNVLTTATNRHLLKPDLDTRERRRSNMAKARNHDLGRSGSGSDSGGSHSSSLVDLVVEDVQGEEAERVRARKEGGPRWNMDEQRRFIITHDRDDAVEGQEIREGYEPAEAGPSEVRVGAGEDGDRDGETAEIREDSEGKDIERSLDDAAKAWRS